MIMKKVKRKKGKIERETRLNENVIVIEDRRKEGGGDSVFSHIT